MTPGTFNITITKGTTFKAIVLTINPDDPLDLTGWSAFAEVRASSGGSVVLDLAPSITDAAGGEITLTTLTDEQTALLPAGNYQWDLLLEDASGEIFGRVLAGRFSIIDKITLSS